MFRSLDIQQHIPAGIKFRLKPYYRKLFPNRLHVVINPTWRCNYRCSYCPVVTRFAYTSVVPKAAERSATDWLRVLEKLPPAAVYIAGGEPFVYAELAAMINGLPKEHTLLGIVTNLSQPTSLYRKITRRAHLNASFHREHVSAVEFTSKARELSGQFHIHCNLVATPENLADLSQIAADLKAANVPLHVDPYINREFRYSPEQLSTLRRYLNGDRHLERQLNFDDFRPRSCSAGRNYVTFAPDGSAYTCYGGMDYNHSPLYADLARRGDVSGFRMGNVFDPDFRLRESDFVCQLPCNAACDRDAVIMRPL